MKKKEKTYTSFGPCLAFVSFFLSPVAPVAVVEAKKTGRGVVAAVAGSEMMT
jgi:hypothetical protein